MQTANLCGRAWVPVQPEQLCHLLWCFPPGSRAQTPLPLFQLQPNNTETQNISFFAFFPLLFPKPRLLMKSVTKYANQVETRMQPTTAALILCPWNILLTMSPLSEQLRVRSSQNSLVLNQDHKTRMSHNLARRCKIVVNILGSGIGSVFWLSTDLLCDNEYIAQSCWASVSPSGKWVLLTIKRENP